MVAEFRDLENPGMIYTGTIITFGTAGGCSEFWPVAIIRVRNGGIYASRLRDVTVMGDVEEEEDHGYAVDS